jgi:hypothetical protein
MNSELVGMIRLKMEGRNLDDLVKIYETNNREEYTDEAFEAIRQILEAEGIQVPIQREYVAVEIKKDKQGFFSFNRLYGKNLIRIIYPVGLVFTHLLLIGQFYTALKSGIYKTGIVIAAGIILFIVYNLALRLLCELCVAIFNISESVKK